MRIYSRNKDKVFNDAVFYFTDEELKELAIELAKLLEDDNYTVNFLGTDKEGMFTKKLKISIYNDNNIANYDERIKTVIKENK